MAPDIKAISPMQEDASHAFARHATGLPYEALPPEAVEMTKQVVMDTLGVTLAATSLSPEAKIVAKYVKDLGGKRESTLLGFGGKGPAPWAVFSNGGIAHMADYDDTDGRHGHCGITTVPVAFAVGEKLGGISGRDLIAAISIAIDIQVRLNRAIPDLEWPMTEGWFSSQLLGYFSGTAVAGRLLGLSEAQMISAFGIAFNQACGSREMASGVSTHLRGMQGGFSGQSSVLSAMLAQRGLIGSENSIEGRYGLYKTYVRVKPNRDALIDNLGVDFPMLKVHGYKAWPACQFTHSPIQSVQNLRQRYGIRPQDVQEAVIIGGSMHTQLLSEPVESKRTPQTSADGKYSIPFTVAIALAKDNVTLKSYTPAGLKDEEVLAMARRVRYQPLPEEKKTSHIPIVEIHTTEGQVYSEQAMYPLGRAQNPLSQKQLEDKFLDCVSFSAKKIPQANIERVVELIRRLEEVKDATEVIRLLA